MKIDNLPNKLDIENEGKIESTDNDDGNNNKKMKVMVTLQTRNQMLIVMMRRNWNKRRNKETLY